METVVEIEILAMLEIGNCIFIKLLNLTKEKKHKQDENIKKETDIPQAPNKYDKGIENDKKIRIDIIMMFLYKPVLPRVYRVWCKMPAKAKIIEATVTTGNKIEDSI